MTASHSHLWSGLSGVYVNDDFAFHVSGLPISAPQIDAPALKRLNRRLQTLRRFAAGRRPLHRETAPDHFILHRIASRREDA